MRLLEFRVENYRNIENSGWIKLDRVTAFVGRNESGKTTLLKALHKFNPATEEPYDGQKDFPRDRYTTEFKDAKDWRVCTTRFEISGPVIEKINGLLPEGMTPPEIAECHRYYDGTLRISFIPSIALPELNATSVTEALTAFASAARRLPSPPGGQRAEKAMQATRTGLAQWAQQGIIRLEAFPNLRDASALKLLDALKSEADAHSGPQTADIVEDLIKQISAVRKNAGIVNPFNAVWQLVSEHLPVFIYFENYGVLDSAVWLPRYLHDKKANPNSPPIRTITAMFEHVGLSADDLLALGRDKASEQRRSGQEVTQAMVLEDQRRKEERAIKLSSASSAITRMFGEWWSQRRHKIRYDADGDFFRIWVADNRRPDVEIELESRSKGFQWFFSFYLVFLVESEQGHKDAVLLLDEPGLNLHPTAQQELISFFERLSAGNQLVYSTHSPFLIDGENLQRVRAVVETEDGHSQISDASSWPKDRETIFPLQAAAGYAMLRGLFAARDNVLLEGMSDYYLLQALNPRCAAAGLANLPETTHLVPCGGVPMVSKIASLFLGENVRPVVLLDGDAGGKQGKSALTRDLYRGEGDQIILLDDIIGGQETEIEDILGEDFYVSAANSALQVSLQLNDDDRAKSSVVDKVTACAKRNAVELPSFWKITVVLYIVGEWAEGRSACSREILERGAAVFAAINHRFAARKS